MLKNIPGFIFPPLSQLAVFVFSATLMSMFIYVGTLSGAAIYMFQSAMDLVLETFQNTENYFAWFIFSLALLCLFLWALYLIFSPLIAPFIKKDLRRSSAFMVFIDAVILIAANIIGRDANPLIGSFIVIYTLAWIIFIDMTCYTRRFDLLMTNIPANPRITLIAGAFAIVLAFVLNQFFHIWWANAYLSATISTLIVVKLFKTRYSDWLEKSQQR